MFYSKCDICGLETYNKIDGAPCSRLEKCNGKLRVNMEKEITTLSEFPWTRLDVEENPRTEINIPLFVSRVIQDEDDEGNYMWIADVYGDTETECEKNANLVSAASDLLLAGKDMCILVREIMKEVRPGSSVLDTYKESPAFKRMMDAINKAQGKKA